MRLLLYPYRPKAYGQDFLLDSIASHCDLTPWRATEKGYQNAPKNTNLLVSHNLDNSADSEFIQLNAFHCRAIGHIHCQFAYYTPRQRNRIVQAARSLHLGVVPAEFHRVQMQQQFPMIRWAVVHNGIPLQRYTPSLSSERKAFRQSLGLAPDVMMAIFIGRLEPAKGLQVLDALCRNLPNTGVTLLLQFLAHSGIPQQYKHIAEQLKTHAPDQVILYPDKDPSSERPVRFADVLIMPSLSEVAPLVALEALAAGLPIIATRATGFYDELVDRGLSRSHFQVLEFPSDFDSTVCRSSLKLSNSAKTRLVRQFLESFASLKPRTDRERQKLSSEAQLTGINQASMIEQLRSIYE